MTRRHFVALANVLRSIKPPSEMKEAHAMWVDAARSIASICASDNPRFDRPRFLVACGVT